HVFRINLTAGAYLRLLVTPRDVILQSQLSAPGGTEDIGVSFIPTEKGTRFVSLVAESPGSYRLEIRLAEDVAKTGRYEVKIEELRPATERDKMRVAAEKDEAEGLTLLNRISTSEQGRR